MNVGTLLFHGITAAMAASLTLATVQGWGIDAPQKEGKSVREDSNRGMKGRRITGGGVHYGK